MSLKHLFKREFLTSQEREDLLDLPYDQASFKFCHIVGKFCDENQIRVSRDLTTLEAVFTATVLFEIFQAVQVYNSDKFWNVQNITELIEDVIKRGITV